MAFPGAFASSVEWRMRWTLYIAATLALLLAPATLLHAQTGEPERKIRNVTPKNIPVIILPPRKEDPRAKKQDEPPIAGESMIAQVSEDGGVTANNIAVQFIGVTKIPSDTLCETADGGRWACGLRAYVALRALVHGKEIKCETLGNAARCFRERVNISSWLLGEGWAIYDEAAQDEALSRAAKDAQKNRRGIWLNGSRPVKR
jgi:endonuclease YncB( thermonuclease family)